MDNKTSTLCKRCGQIINIDESCTNCTVSELTTAEPWQQALNTIDEDIPAASLLDSNSHRRFVLANLKCKIGRDKTNQVMIDDDPFISRFHALVSVEEGHFFVEDLGSTNGTLINGSPLIRRRPLVNGDRLRIGRSDLLFMLEEIPLGKSVTTSGQVIGDG